MKYLFRGVCTGMAGHFASQIFAGGKHHRLGRFKTQHEAGAAYDNAAFYLRKAGMLRAGRLNFPEEYVTTPERPFVPPPTPATLAVISAVQIACPDLTTKQQAKQVQRSKYLELMRGVRNACLASVDALQEQVDRAETMLIELGDELAIAREDNKTS